MTLSVLHVTPDQREQELAVTLDTARRALLRRLPRKLRVTQGGGRVPAKTFEQSAEEIGRPVAAELKDYQDAVNALWIHAIDCGTVGRLAATWTRNHRGLREWVSRDRVDAEVMFILRKFIARFVPGRGTLYHASYRGVHQHLTEWLAQQQGAVQLPQKVARDVKPTEVVAPLTDRQTDNPEDALVALLDTLRGN